MIVGDKVICVDNEGAEDTLIKDAVYTVSTVFNDGFIEVSNMKCCADRFKNISDLERMCGYIGLKSVNKGFKSVNKGLKRGKKMKTIRRLEEFDKLENGMGLKLIVRASSYKGCVWVKIYYNTWLEIKDIENFNESDIRLLKAMGFEFEWKPKRTLEEVLNDYEEIDFVVEQDNCAVYEDARNGGFSVGVYRGYKTAGTKYYLRKDAEKICKELNS